MVSSYGNAIAGIVAVDNEWLSVQYSSPVVPEVPEKRIQPKFIETPDRIVKGV